MNRLHVVFKKAQQSLLKSITAMRARPVVVRPCFSTATSTSAALRPFELATARKPAWVPLNPCIINFHIASQWFAFQAPMARRNLCSIIHDVS